VIRSESFLKPGFEPSFNVALNPGRDLLLNRKISVDGISPYEPFYARRTELGKTECLDSSSSPLLELEWNDLRIERKCQST
jgi:hypothetical protein